MDLLNPDLIWSFENENELIQALTDENVEVVYQRVDKDNNSLLFYAVQKGFNQVAQQILESPINYRVDGKAGSTPLHFAPNSSESVLRLLLIKHYGFFDICDNKGYNVLHQWAELQFTWQLALLRGAEFQGRTRLNLQRMSRQQNRTEFEDYPIHIAALNGNLECVKFIINEIYDEIVGGTPPWRAQNNYEQTPLHRAIYNEQNEIALYLLQRDPTLSKIHDNGGQSPFLLSVLRGSRCEDVVREIMKIRTTPRETVEEERERVLHYYRDLRKNDGTTVLHWLYGCTERLGMILLKKYWWLISLTDDNGKTALHYAVKNNRPWLVRMLRNPSLINDKTNIEWETEFTAELSWVLPAFAKSCKDLPKICRVKGHTPLHYIKFDTYTEYVDFLNIPSVAELKNVTDLEGATPLHQAIKRQDINMVQALLTDLSVDRYMKDGDGRTAMELLSKQCDTNNDMKIMCKHIRVNPGIKTSYIRPETNLDQIRTSLSVVAALLATITFAAGFTLPGGLDDKTGHAKLPKRAAFILFLLADAVAMCTSILVLFCLIWSMVSNYDMSRVLVEYSIYILTYISLPSTAMAFMSGIYTVIKHTFIEVIIVFFISSSLIIIIAYKRILFYMIAKLVPAVNQGTSPQERQRTGPEVRISMGPCSHQNDD